MDRTPDNWLTRRSLFKGRLFEVAHVVCRPTPDLRHEVTYAGLNVLALPTAGVFALHPSPRRHVVATPNHAVFISSGRHYRVTFPGCIGDECLTLHLSPEGIARLVPEAMAREGFDESTLFARAVLPQRKLTSSSPAGPSSWQTANEWPAADRMMTPSRPRRAAPLPKASGARCRGSRRTAAPSCCRPADCSGDSRHGGGRSAHAGSCA